jgi:hypothetical protein
MFLSTSSKLPPGLLTWTAFIFDMIFASRIYMGGNAGVNAERKIMRCGRSW